MTRGPTHQHSPNGGDDMKDMKKTLEVTIKILTLIVHTISGVAEILEDCAGD